MLSFKNAIGARWIPKVKKRLPFPKALSFFWVSKKGDTEKEAEYIADKILHLRIFEDENDKLNLSLLDVKGELAIVSQFTLYGDARKGRRPSFSQAELPERANALYEYVVDICRKAGVSVGTGRFRTHMKVALENDGPVTLLLDSDKNF